MSVEIKTPMLPESVTDAAVAVCHKSEGDWCETGDVIAELETDKVMLEVTATCAGQLIKMHVKEGDVLVSDALIATIDDQAKSGVKSEEKVAEEKVAEVKSSHAPQVSQDPQPQKEIPQPPVARMSPSKRREAYEGPVTSQASRPVVSQSQVEDDGSFERRPMSRLRAKIASRLVEATQETAMLTTFNEVCMDPIIEIRKTHQDAFTEKHGVKLGFMSFFVQAVCKALAEFPEVNASIDGHDVLYHHGQHIGIAVSTERGLVVPVLRDAQNMSYADIEREIKAMASTARAGKIGLEQLQGGTFTITNGGVFGSMLSTPILNMPQSAILGMHAIQKRAVVIDDQVSVASMMYLALSYDHRLIDGQQSVQFLVRVKSMLEDPDQVLLDL